MTVEVEQIFPNGTYLVLSGGSKSMPEVTLAVGVTITKSPQTLDPEIFSKGNASSNRQHFKTSQGSKTAIEPELVELQILSLIRSLVKTFWSKFTLKI